MYEVIINSRDRSGGQSDSVSGTVNGRRGVKVRREASKAVVGRPTRLNDYDMALVPSPPAREERENHCMAQSTTPDTTGGYDDKDCLACSCPQ